MRRTNSLEKTLMLGKIEGRRRRGRQRMRWMVSPTQWTWVWVYSESWWWTGRPGVLQSMGLQRVGHDWWLNWTVPCKVQYHFQYLQKYSTAAGIQELASSEQVRRVTDWRKERRWEMVELKDCQQEKTKGKLQLHSLLIFMEHTFTLLKAHNLNVLIQGPYCMTYF